MDKLKSPLITIGVVSCNRFYYLRALLESAKICVTYPNVEWIVVDNASKELGLVEYLKQQSFIDHLVLNEKRSPTTEHTDALNLITENAKGEYILILSDDVQFIRKDWETEFINILKSNPEITSISLSALRKITLNRYFKDFGIEQLKHIAHDLKQRGVIRSKKVFITENGEKFISFGYMREPLDGVGMLIFSRTKMWKDLGPWKINKQNSNSSIDSSSGGENNMLKRAIALKIKGHMVTPITPVIATIVTDNQGLNARVRANKRYGNYFAPSGNLYYDLIDNANGTEQFPQPLEDILKPIGFSLPLDEKGNMIKGSVNFSVENEII